MLNNCHKIKEIQEIQNQFSIPAEIIQVFINTSSSDIYLKKLETKEELLRYCYGVASTVGLSMCHLFGIKEKQAYYHAIDLGIAMQLTNICRDIQEDYNMNRIYLPELNNIYLSEENNEEIRKVQDNYLRLADKYYQSGIQGLRFLPLRLRFVVFVAAKLYKRIGNVIRKENNYQIRSYVNSVGKFFVNYDKHPSILNPKLKKISFQHDKNLHQYLNHLPYINE